MPYELERARFAGFRSEIQRRLEVLTAMQQSVRDIYERYDTRVRENRFVVGGVIEHIVGAVLCACGVPVQHRGASATEVDLVFEDAPGGYSVKAMFRASSTRLVNVLSGEPPTLDRWQAATLFLIQTGIVYADRALPWWITNGARCVRSATDALIVQKRCVAAFAQRHPDWFVASEFPGRSGGHPGRSIASADLAVQILRHYPVLFSHLPGLIAGSGEA